VNNNIERGLEPGFRVLFSAIFHGVSLGIAIRAEHYGIVDEPSAQRVPE
jgi:hypothetical protein